MKYIIKNIIPAAAFALTLGMTSCTGDLDVDPIDPNLSTEVSLDGLYLKCYANLALPGNGGANGDSDIDGYDGGTAGFIRQLWNSNELPTDESICCWGDPGISGFNFNQYDAAHPMMHMFYYRLTTGINYCNSYINEVGEGGDAQKVAEVRFVRALQYYMLMDAFGNIPFTTALSKPEQISRVDAYNWIEKELLELEPQLMDAKAMKSTDDGYGRATKGAAWMLLARLYLNAEVYTGTAQWAKAAEYAKKVIDAGYRLNTTGANQWSAYQMLFMADNGESSAAYEAVFPILQDGSTTTSWGGTLFCIASTFDGNMHANPDDGVATNNTTQAWGGNRARPELVKKFFPLGNAPEDVQSYAMAAAPVMTVPCFAAKAAHSMSRRPQSLPTAMLLQSGPTSAVTMVPPRMHSSPIPTSSCSVWQKLISPMQRLQHVRTVVPRQQRVQITSTNSAVVHMRAKLTATPLTTSSMSGLVSSTTRVAVASTSSVSDSSEVTTTTSGSGRAEPIMAHHSVPT